jgi:Rha family phage regulatory protein
MNEFGLTEQKGQAVVDSRYVAQEFQKRHDNVLKDIQNLDCSDNFRLLNFEESSYKNNQNKKQPCYLMTRDGFMFLVMGYRGKKAASIKEFYIHEFNAMEEFITDVITARKEFPLLTDNIKMLHDEPKHYHFSNECNLINQVALGMTAKKFRELHGLGKTDSIRPFLSPEQIKLVDILQKVDIGLLVSIPDYQQRKRMLEWYKMKYEGKLLVG